MCKMTKCRSDDYFKSLCRLPYFMVVIGCDLPTQIVFGSFHISHFNIYEDNSIADRSD